MGGHEDEPWRAAAPLDYVKSEHFDKGFDKGSEAPGDIN